MYYEMVTRTFRTYIKGRIIDLCFLKHKTIKYIFKPLDLNINLKKGNNYEKIIKRKTTGKH